MDQNLPYQQNLEALDVPVVLVHAKSNRMSDLRPLIPAILQAFADAAPGRPAARWRLTRAWSWRARPSRVEFILCAG
jgi:hypothetical protein